MKKLIALWMLFLLFVMATTIWALVTVKPNTKVDCYKAMQLWNHDEGQAAIAAFKGQNAKADMLKNEYTNLVLGPNRVCFPPNLIDYVSGN